MVTEAANTCSQIGIPRTSFFNKMITPNKVNAIEIPSLIPKHWVDIHSSKRTVRLEIKRKILSEPLTNTNS